MNNPERISQHLAFRSIGSEEALEHVAGLASHLQSFETTMLTQNEIRAERAGFQVRNDWNAPDTS